MSKWILSSRMHTTIACSNISIVLCAFVSDIVQHCAIKTTTNPHSANTLNTRAIKVQTKIAICTNGKRKYFYSVQMKYYCSGNLQFCLILFFFAPFFFRLFILNCLYERWIVDSKSHGEYARFYIHCCSFHLSWFCFFF